MTWPRRPVTVNDTGNDGWTYIACPTCSFWEAKLIPEIIREPSLMATVISTARVVCPHCDGP